MTRTEFLRLNVPLTLAEACTLLVYGRRNFRLELTLDTDKTVLIGWVRHATHTTVAVSAVTDATDVTVAETYPNSTVESSEVMETLLTEQIQEALNPPPPVDELRAAYDRLNFGGVAHTEDQRASR